MGDDNIAYVYDQNAFPQTYSRGNGFEQKLIIT